MTPPEEPRSRQSNEPEAGSPAEPQAASEPQVSPELQLSPEPQLSPELQTDAGLQLDGEQPAAAEGADDTGAQVDSSGADRTGAERTADEVHDGGTGGGAADRQAADAPLDDETAAPSFLFFGLVAAVSLVADVVSKAWAEVTMNARGFVPIELIPDHLNIILAYNRGGAWGLLQNASEVVRKPFFLGVSVAAILFIVSLYSKLHPSQRALKWGLPLVLGGALGNLSDRITRGQVIDFIDYQGEWVLALNTFVRRYVNGWTITDHWPTFNVADIAICVGVGLMAVDMFTSRRLRQSLAEQGQGQEQGHDPSPAESRSA